MSNLGNQVIEIGETIYLVSEIVSLTPHSCGIHVRLRNGDHFLQNFPSFDYQDNISKAKEIQREWISKLEDKSS